MKKRQFVTISLVMVVASFAQADQDPLVFPLTPPAIDAASWVLMDATTGQVLTQGNADERRNPASLTKLMTGYVVDRAIDSKRITRDNMVTVAKMPGLPGMRNFRDRR